MKKKVFREKYNNKVAEKMIEEIIEKTEAKTINVPKVSEYKEYKKKSDK